VQNWRLVGGHAVSTPLCESIQIRWRGIAAMIIAAFASLPPYPASAAVGPCEMLRGGPRIRRAESLDWDVRRCRCHTTFCLYRTISLPCRSDSLNMGPEVHRAAGTSDSSTAADPTKSDSQSLILPSKLELFHIPRLRSFVTHHHLGPDTPQESGIDRDRMSRRFDRILRFSPPICDASIDQVRPTVDREDV
jgi:hypothetical protein